MLRFCGTQLFSIVKAKKIVKQYNVRAIAEALKVQAEENDESESITKKYLLMWKDPKSVKFSRTEFIKADKEFKVVDFTKTQICNHYKEYTQEVAMIIDNFVTFITKIYLENLSLKDDSVPLELLHNYIRCTNQFFTLIPRSKRMSMLFIEMCRVTHFSIKSFSTSQLFSCYRMAVDNLRRMPLSEFTSQEINIILTNFGVVNIHYWHYAHSFEYIKYFLGGVDLKDTSKVLRILFAIQRLGVYSSSLLNTYNKILLNKNFTTTHLAKTLKYLVHMFYITKDNSHLYIQLIQTIMRKTEESYKSNTYRMICISFYRANIWMKEFWVPFFQFLNKSPKAVSKIELYHVSVVYHLLKMYEDQIDSQILVESKKTWNEIIKIFPEMEDPTFLNKNYNKEFPDNFASSKLTCQLQIANSLRLFNHGNVRSEAFVSLFIVDILVRDKYVIEVNGKNHCIYDLDGGKKYNLKTTFRDNTLKKMGYCIINIDLEEHGEGSFRLIEHVISEIKKFDQQAQSL